MLQELIRRMNEIEKALFKIDNAIELLKNDRFYRGANAIRKRMQRDRSSKQNYKNIQSGSEYVKK